MSDETIGHLPEPPYAEVRIFCPFSESGRCPSDCPSMRERACINGEDDE